LLHAFSVRRQSFGRFRFGATARRALARLLALIFPCSTFLTLPVLSITTIAGVFFTPIASVSGPWMKRSACSWLP